MTEGLSVADQTRVTPERKIEGQAVFINWPVNNDDVEACDLLDGTDFSGCKLAFFDPFEFAVSNGFWSRNDDISEVAYVSFEEIDFLRYLAASKTASETLRAFLRNGGMLTIRANIPKSYIQVRKKSSTGTTRYTESIVSTFFWLEDILGVYSIRYCGARTLKYLMPKNPLKKVFGNVEVRCVQTVNSVGKGKMQAIAGSGTSPKAVAIARITFDSESGQVYLIPKFIIKNEAQHLIEAFEKIYNSRESGSVRPHWLGHYEDQLRQFSPYRPQMDEIELQIEALKKQRGSLMRKQKKFDGVVDLLFESDTELQTAARTALDIMGFDCSAIPHTRKANAFEARPVDDKSTRLMVRAVSTDAGPVPPEEVEKLTQAMKSGTSAIKAKGLLIGNAARSMRPEQRESWFDERCLNEAKREDLCLMPSLVLFTMACYIMTRMDTDNIEKLKNSLQRDIIRCDKLFVLSRKKYVI